MWGLGLHWGGRGLGCLGGYYRERSDCDSVSEFFVSMVFEQ